MSNGSLEDVLATRARRKGLNAETRVRIALGVAQALDYLHTPWLDKPAIIHRDVKVYTAVGAREIFIFIFFFVHFFFFSHTPRTTS